MRDAELDRRLRDDVDAAARGDAEPSWSRRPSGPPTACLRLPTGERDRGAELRRRRGWAWIRPTRSYDEYRRRIAAASEQLAEQRAAELLAERDAAEPAPH